MSRKSVQCIAAVAVIGLAWLAPTAVEAQTGPDLGISGLVAVSGLYGITPPGWPLSLSATVRNDGDAASAATTLRYYLSTDATITTSDTSVGTDAVGALAAGATSSPPRLDFNAPSAPGTYYYGACVDAVTGESDTTNNCSTSVQVTVSEAATGPDLDPYAIVVTTSPGGTGPGGNVGPSVGVRNEGDESSAATTVRFYQSTDATITTADTEVGTNALGALSPGATASIGATVSAPSTPGTYYYGACVDAVAGESDTTNNCSGSVPVVVSGSPVQTSPDLTVGSPSVTDSTPDTGGSLTLSATVNNGGDGDAAATTLRYYRSTDGTITTSDTSVGTDAVGGLSAGATSPESISLTAPSTAGTYYYGACVDAVSGESDTTNNCSSAVSVTVSAPPPPPPAGPDLTVHGIITVTSLDGTPPGGSFQLGASVRNDGDESSAATTVRFYQSTDATITTSDTEVGTNALGALSPGATASIGATVSAPSTPGTYYYGACVDAVAGESDTTNNCSGSVPVVVSGSPVQTSPDLTVGSPSVNDNSPTTGESLTLSATVRNDGDGDAAATTLRYYRSTDGTITTSDTSVGTDAIGGLAASATSSESVSLTAPATAGTYYYGACVDAVTGESDTTNNCSTSVQIVVLATAQQEVEPKPPGEVQAVVDEAVARAGGLRAGGAPVTIEVSTLFSFGAGGSENTTYTARSSDPELVTAEITDGQLVLTPGNPPPAGAFSSLAVGAAAGDPVRVMITVTAERGGEMAEVESTVDVLESATGGGPRITVPDAPTNLLADGGNEQVALTWDAPENDGGAAITDYEYRIDQTGEWISIGSTDTTHTVTGLVNGTEYVFEVRAVNRIGKSFFPNRAEATPEAPEVFTLNFAHFANGTGITSEMVLVNVSPHPIRPAIYFYDTEGAPLAAESVLEVTGDLEVTEDGSLSVLTEMEPLEALTISTHGQGELVSGSVKVLSDGPIGGGVRYGLPEIGVAGVGASPPVRDVLFPARRQEGGIRTATALHNLEAEAMGVSCRLMSGGVALEEVEIPLEANGQTSWFIEEAFTTTDTSDFLGSVRCTAPGRRRFTAIAVEMDAAQRIFNTLSVVPVDRTGGGGGETVLDFAHFANGTWITDLVFLNLSTEASRPAPTPFHTDILPSRPEIYFYDTEGNPIAAASVVDITGDLEITEDGALTVRTEMEPLGVLTISPHGRGALVSGSVRVVSEGPIGGMLRFEHPDLGVAGVGASPPVSDVLFPVRRQEGGITTWAAIHNLESSPELVHCDLMREGVLLDAVSIPLEANGQTSWFIEDMFTATDTTDFLGSVRCSAVGEGLFTAVALEMDSRTRIFTTLPVVPVAERMSQE